MSNSIPVAYSHLPKVLARHRWKISDLWDRLKAAGIHVNQKSLYRLTTAEPLHKIDTRILGAICQSCAVGIQELITFEQPKAVLGKLARVEQERLDDLMTRHNEEDLSAGELRELDELSAQAHQLTLANARMLAAQRRSLKSNRSPRIVKGQGKTMTKRTAPAKKV